MKPATVLVMCLAGLLLVACKLQQEGPPPSHESATLETARSISGVPQAETPASSAHGGSPK